MEEGIFSEKRGLFIFIRYIILLILVLSSTLIYKILTPLTVYATYLGLKLFYPVAVFGTQILVNHVKAIEIIPPCVAGSAYVLLLILNLFVAMKPKQRIYSLLFSFVLFFIFNILRIIILSVLLVNDFEFFYITHKLAWYVLSTVLVVAIWFLTMKIFSIKEMPAVSDIKYLLNNIRGREEIS